MMQAHRPPAPGAVRYATLGFSTRREVYWTASVVCALALAGIAMHAMQTGQALIWTAARTAWVVGLLLGTFRILRRLGELEREGQEPDDGMKLAFQCAAMLPMVGTLPLIMR